VGLDLVGDVGDHLHGLAQVFAPAFFADDVLVDPSSSDVVRLAGGHVQEPLVVAQIQVGLRTIFRYETLPMLIRIQRARIHIDVGVQFLDGDREPTRLQQLR